MKRAKTKESGFAKYMRRALEKDERARVLFFAEVMKAPLASQLRLLRHFRGLSQMMVSKRTRLAQPEVARLERAGANPRAETLERLAKGLGARVEIIPEKLVPFLGAQQLRAQGEAYLERIALSAR